MQALRIKVRVENNRIAADLPPEVPDGEAELVLMYEESPGAGIEQRRRNHLEALLTRVRRRSSHRSREDIDRQIAEERASWGD